MQNTDTGIIDLAPDGFVFTEDDLSLNAKESYEFLEFWHLYGSFSLFTYTTLQQAYFDFVNKLLFADYLSFKALAGLIANKQSLKNKVLIVTTHAERTEALAVWKFLHDQYGIALEFVDLDSTSQVNYQQLEEVLQNSEHEVKIVSLPFVHEILGSVNSLELLRKIKKETNAYFALYIGANFVCAKNYSALSRLQEMDMVVFDLDEASCPIFCAYKSSVFNSPDASGFKNSSSNQEESTYKTVAVKDSNAYGFITDYNSTFSNNKSFIFAKKCNKQLININFDKKENSLPFDKDQEKELETKVAQKLLEKLLEYEAIGILGPVDAESRCGVVSFVVAGVEPNEVFEFFKDGGIIIGLDTEKYAELYKKFGVYGVNMVNVAKLNEQNLQEFLDLLSDFMFKFGITQ